MAWVLVYETLDHGDSPNWGAALRLTTRAIPLVALTQEDAEREAAAHRDRLLVAGPFPRISNVRLRQELELPVVHLSLDEFKAAVFRHGDEHPDHTLAWQDEAQRLRVTAHLIMCEHCRRMVDEERVENPLYKAVCVERSLSISGLSALAAAVMAEPTT